ncbi:hypothetical protein AB9P05_21860 [Roseivirga sp. BDSF3-8]|uniref:hypothetical protein n=1 Tax=Roseivirga sp. BDSF3-8 TaxID=3241598 RepID=UPI0035325C12
MKKLGLIVFIALIMFSCSSTSEREIDVFNDITFSVKADEKIVPIDPVIRETFDSHLQDPSIQMPLFRAIQAEGYMIFLAIPVNTSLQELSNQASGDADYFYAEKKHNDKAISMYARQFDKNLVYVLTVSESIELSDSLFNESSLAERFTK